MSKLELAALLAATVLGASSAQAATFVRYEITALGSESGWSSLGVYQPLNYKGYTLTYQFLAGKDKISFYGADAGDSYLWKDGSYSLTDTGVTMTESHQAHHYYRSFTTSFCTDGPPAFVTAYNGTPSCGSMYVRTGDWNNGDPIVYDFYGKITSLKASTFEGDTYETAFGVVGIAAAVPEPTTWAMMLLGFGMIAGAARYRHRSTEISFV